MSQQFIKAIALLLIAVLCLSTVAGCVDPGTGDPGTGGDDIPTKKRLQADELVSDTDPLVKWEGRYEYKTHRDTPMVMMYHTATGFTVDFYGTELKATFYHQATATGGSNIYYQVAVDGESLPTANKDRVICLSDGKITETVTLVKGLEKGHHTLTCLKMSEPADALTGIIDISTDGGIYRRDTQADSERLKFMFICASGGSGFGSLVCTPKNSVSRTRANSSSLHSFNYLTARMFDADVQYVAQSGWGVAFPKTKSISDVLDYSGILGYNVNESYKNSVVGAQTTGLWDHSRWVPDVIIFNIGGNDTPQSSFNLTTYQNEVVEMVEKLHELYPNAKMIWTHTNSKAGTYAMQALSSAGIVAEGYLKAAIIPKVGSDGTYGASNHNSFKTHIATADILAKALEAYGYAPVRPNVVYEDYAQFITTK